MACNTCSETNPHTTTACNGCVGCSQKCHEVVDTYPETDSFRNAFVTVREENAIYHVDDVGNVIVVSRSPIFDDAYEPVEGEFKNNVVYNFSAGEFYVFNAEGEYKTGTLV